VLFVALCQRFLKRRQLRLKLLQRRGRRCVRGLRLLRGGDTAAHLKKKRFFSFFDLWWW
jgi:hypothetical protein